MTSHPVVPDPPAAEAPRSRPARLLRALERAAHFLPAQAPLEVFVHHNTLHAYQHLPFHDAIEAARARTGAAGYLPVAEYRDALAAGRIRLDDLDDAIASAPLDLPTSGAPGLPSARALARAVLLHDVRSVSRATLTWELTEHEADHRFASHVSDVARGRIAAETAAWVRRELQALGPSADLRALASSIVGVSEEGGALADVRARFRETLGVELGHEGIARALEEHLEAVSVSSLWTACRDLVDALPPSIERPPPSGPTFVRELLTSRGEDDPDELVSAVLIPACASFLDRGQSHWSMPDRERGFFEAWARVLTSGAAVRPAWLADLGDALRGWREAELGSLEVAARAIDELGIDDDELDAFVEHTLMKLPGWAGMFHQLETAPGPIGRSHARVRLLDYLAVRLVLDVEAARDVGRRAGHRGPPSGLREHLRRRPSLAGARDDGAPGPARSAWSLFQLAQHAGVSGPTLRASGAAGATLLRDVLSRLDEPARLRIWHEAYERRYRDQLLHALSSSRGAASQPVPRSYQIVCCIDDRAESLRRHFEELSAAHETFGTAGFFNLAIAYQGVDDPSTFPLCPVVVEPHHRIEEQPTAEHVHLAESRRRWRKRLGWLETRFDRASRSMLWGPLVTALAGAGAALPLLVEVFAPRFAARTRRAATRRLLPELRTELTVPRTSGDSGEGTHALLAGFTVDEKAARVATLLENIGLTRDFAPIVAILGHDSSSVNNFHFAAYSCGACGGRSGGPNARLFARMANRAGVRALLRERGIDIPDGTVFVGGVHDTCADTIRFYDVERVPEEHAPRLDALHHQLDAALARNAHERCRRFESAPRDPWQECSRGRGPDGSARRGRGREGPDRASRADPRLEVAHDHVEGRSVDLSQPRPELGHATNAGCVVGRRALTEGLFLDRRVFLVSYDPSIDPDGAVLERTLSAVGPVCAGINLEYFFSTTDNERYGAGTKLPHNVTALVGVMNGACSDLRTGLPKQMIEIHEPMRLQLVIESDEATLRGVLERQPGVRELVRNEWIHVTLCHPVTGALSIVDPARGARPWEPRARSLSVVRSSREWYRGRSGPLAPARIEPPRDAGLGAIAGDEERAS